MSEEGQVIDSCGCVFCDLDLSPERLPDGSMAHPWRGVFYACRRAQESDMAWEDEG